MFLCIMQLVFRMVFLQKVSLQNFQDADALADMDDGADITGIQQIFTNI